MSATVSQMLAELQGEPRPPKAHPFPGNVLMHVDGFDEADDSCNPDHGDNEVRTTVTDLDSAVVITSLVAEPFPPPADVHRPVLDIDVPVTLLSSSTPGHHHLLIDKPMTWEQYKDLLVALKLAGIVEGGYVAASERRGHSAVRVPWLRKGDPLPLLPEERAKRRAADIEQAARDLFLEKANGPHLAAARLRALLDIPEQGSEVW